MEDTLIVELYLSKNEQAIEESAKKYGSRLKNLAYGIVEDEQTAEECENDTYLGAWNTIPPEQPTHFPAYLVKLARNISISRYRAGHAQKRGGGETELILSELENCLPSESTTEKAFDEILLTKSIENFLKGESKEKRRIFLLRYWYSFSISEIAKELSQSESKVTSTLFRLRLKLKEHLEKEGIFI